MSKKLAHFTSRICGQLFYRGTFVTTNSPRSRRRFFSTEVRGRFFAGATPLDARRKLHEQTSYVAVPVYACMQLGPAASLGEGRNCATEFFPMPTTQTRMKPHTAPVRLCRPLARIHARSCKLRRLKLHDRYSVCFTIRGRQTRAVACTSYRCQYSRW